MFHFCLVFAGRDIITNTSELHRCMTFKTSQPLVVKMSSDHSFQDVGNLVFFVDTFFLV